MKRKKSRSVRGPVSTILILTIVICFLSLILSLIGFEGNRTYIGTGELETSVVSVKTVIRVLNIS